jgi:hypothetical protein
MKSLAAPVGEPRYFCAPMRGLFRQCRVEKQFFFEKKNQKTFARCRGAIPSTCAKNIKVFCFFFSKKKSFFFSDIL